MEKNEGEGWGAGTVVLGTGGASVGPGCEHETRQRLKGWVGGGFFSREE